MASVLDKIQKIPSKTRGIALAALTVAAIVLFIWQVHIPKTTQIKGIETAISGLKAKIQENDAKIKKLDDLRAEVTALQTRLKVLTEQLPPESEVSDLLRQIQKLVNQSGLSLNVWRPDKRRLHASGLYEEIPITLKLGGGYHNTALLFDRVSKLTRIVNIQNLKMDGAKQAKDGTMEITVDCTAMTFAAVEKKVEAAPTASKKVQ